MLGGGCCGFGSKWPVLAHFGLGPRGQSLLSCVFCVVCSVCRSLASCCVVGCWLSVMYVVVCVVCVLVLVIA